jgi:hypothetical protein
MNQDKNRRKQIVVDKRLQIGSVARLVGVVVGVGVLYMLSLVVFLGRDASVSMNSPQVRQFMVVANGVYFGVAAVLLGTMILMLTHRFAGPTLVLKRAVDGMTQGDFSHRLSLRKHDYLKDLAACIERLRDRMQQDEEVRREVEAHLAEGDVAAARAALSRGDAPRREPVQASA